MPETRNLCRRLKAATYPMWSASGDFRICSILLAATLVVLASAQPARAAGNTPSVAELKAGMACTVTAKAARTACHNDIRDDYWIAVGNCSNLADPGAASECLADALVELRDGRDLCAEQYDSRIDLCDAVGEAPYDPVLDPADFLTGAELLAAATPNPYFPLVPGTTYRYSGGDETTEVSVTGDVVEISGIPALAVHDVVSVAGEAIEDTVDWYAQDVFGNVWYMGEISQQFEDGDLVSLEGSWRAGRDFAKPGIIMQTVPAVGDIYRQEFSLGNAEDAAEVLSTTGTESTPAASCTGDCVVTRDFTPIEPDANEHKFFAPGTGLIVEIDLATGARTELVEVTP